MKRPLWANIVFSLGWKLALAALGIAGLACLLVWLWWKYVVSRSGFGGQ